MIWARTIRSSLGLLAALPERKFQNGWGGALEPALNEVSGVRIWVPVPLPSIKVVQAFVQMFQLLILVSSSEKWQCWSGLFLKSFLILILFDLHEAYDFTFWFLL